MAPKYVLMGNSKEKVGKVIPTDVLLMDNLEISLATTVNKYRGNPGGAILERLIKPRPSTMFGHP